jgi:hypothetical protein
VKRELWRKEVSFLKGPDCLKAKEFESPCPHRPEQFIAVVRAMSTLKEKPARAT